MDNKSFTGKKTLRIVFYPLSYNSTRLNGIGIADDPVSLSDVFSITDCSFIRFIDDKIFFFQKKHNEMEEQPFGYNGNFLYGDEAKNSAEMCIYRDNHGDVNLLKHLVSKSNIIKEKQKKCLLLAIDSGFPNELLIDFDKKELVEKDDVLQRWREMMGDQVTDLKKNFIHTLSQGTKAVLDEYKGLFDGIEMMSVGDPLPSLILIRSTEKFPFFPSQTKIILPKIYFKRVTMKLIIHINQESLVELCKKIKSEFEEYGYKLGYSFAITRKIKIDGQSMYRVKIIFFVKFLEFIPLNDIKNYLIHLKNRILGILEEIYPKSYEKFLDHHTEEIWIKKIDVYILTTKKDIENVRNLTREFFSGIQKKFLTKSLSEKDVAIRIILIFDRFSDFSVSERNKVYDFIDKDTGMPLREIYNPMDKYTRIAIEEIYAKNFRDARKYLRKAMHGLIGDLYTVKYMNMNSESRFKYRHEAVSHYGKAEIDRYTGYMDDPSEEAIKKALRVNGWWRVSLKLYLRARDIRKQKEWSEAVGEKKTKKMSKKLLKKYWALQSRRNINDFSKIMGDFYKSLLLETQKECKDFAKKVLGYSI